MSEELPPTRIVGLQLTNFRCFDSLSIEFNPRLTVLVAPNGGGKTAIMDSLSIAWRLYIDTFLTRKSSQGFHSDDIRRKLSSSNTMEICLPTRLQARAVIASNDKPLNWIRERRSNTSKSKTSIKDASSLTRIAMDQLIALFNEEVKEDDPGSSLANANPTLSLIVQYGTGRLFAEGRLTTQKRQYSITPTSRTNGYLDCLEANSKFKMFVDWFERYSREAQKKRDGHPYASNHEPLIKLKAVSRAVDRVLRQSGWHSLEWDFVEDVIVAHHLDQGTLSVDMLSDGIRTLIGLSADIAHRCVRLNPHLGENAALETPGIVMIDEVDMHLHPEWQQVILQSLLDAFPLMQFIVTTHSPQVISTVKSENIRRLQRDPDGKWIADDNSPNAYGHSNARSLELVMGGRAYPEHLQTVVDLREYQRLVGDNQHDIPRARELRCGLEKVWGPNAHELQLMDISIRRNEALRKLGLHQK